ncbi:DUF4062 domain-containing protein [Erythrobacter sp. YJ-T3-07]|uniref:DUF4062 domain-containing protein n=1 Tax=Erythrobacter sp. YJ-T3-07 TaxID=2793063 RepID=UPI0018D350B7|nr:DUF4062 domain-containing protein [Erythrobacter sp. YJ-T3-07]MBH1943480.1 DUF4062 domain-containing protein [Erythrobacter sp. YJ-T3-07]
MGADDSKLTVMVSSTVYGIRPLLKQVFAMLTGYGHEVLMSDGATVAVDPRKHNFDSCIRAVESCDLFFGLITPSYGTGVSAKENRSVTHMELLKAIELERPRFMLCHQAVVSSRVLLNTLAYEKKPLKGTDGRAPLSLTSKAIIGDIRTIDMLEAALNEGPDFDDRTNHWVQEYESEEDVKRFVATNFDPEGHNREILEDMIRGKAAEAGK